MRFLSCQKLKRSRLKLSLWSFEILSNFILFEIHVVLKTNRVLFARWRCIYSNILNIGYDSYLNVFWFYAVSPSFAGCGGKLWEPGWEEAEVLNAVFATVFNSEDIAECPAPWTGSQRWGEWRHLNPRGNSQWTLAPLRYARVLWGSVQGYLGAVFSEQSWLTREVPIN